MKPIILPKYEDKWRTKFINQDTNMFTILLENLTPTIEIQYDREKKSVKPKL